MVTSAATTSRWMLFSVCCVGLIGLAIAAIFILSLISVYLINKGAGMTICTISFAPMVAQTTGAGPSYVDDADFNKDNILDLLVVNYDAGSISVALGIGNGTFRDQVVYSTGGTASLPNAATIGDLNKDGNLDIVVANSGTHNVGVFLGKGDGTFATQSTYSTGTTSMPQGLDLGDLQGDGIPDVVVSDNANSLVVIMIGTGTGALTMTRALSSGSNAGPYGVAVRDFTGDGQLDIAVSNANANNVGIFVNNGGATFRDQQTYSTGTYPVALAVTDFNKDGQLDIATANHLGNSTSVLLGNGGGTFKGQKVLSNGAGSLPYGIYFGDFNKDNIQDIIVANSGTNNIGIFLGKLRGNFRNQMTFSTGDSSSPNDVTVADYNNDNRVDFISANNVRNTAGVFLSTCA